MHLVHIKNGAQQTRIMGGTQQIVIPHPQPLHEFLHWNSPVQAIEQSSDCVTNRSATGVYRAKYAIVAIPPVLAGQIEWMGGLPVGRRVLHDYMPMGKVIKCVLAYQRPFWRERGFSGEVVSDGKIVQIVFDDSPHDGSFGALVGFMLGNAAQMGSDRGRGERARAVRDEFARFFGPEAAHPIAYLEKDWTIEP